MFQEFIEIFILSVVQGVSEFLPISSSAHLILVSKFYELKTASLIIDISLHLGSLLAIIFYFRKDLISIKNNKKINLFSGPYNTINFMKNDYIQLKKFGFEELDITKR